MQNFLKTQLTVATFCCLSVMGTGNAQVKAPSELATTQLGPDSTEQMFWQSVERLGTPEGYRAYLTRYPSGFFTPLARATLNKAESPLSGAPLSAKGAALNSFSYSPSSGAVSFNIGETFAGPASIGVGWLGQKRQLVLPSGRWIALAAQDESLVLPSTGTNTQIPTRVVVTTVVFGQFTGQRLISAFQFRFSSKKTAPVSWSGIDGCQKSGSMAMQSPPPLATGWRDECLRLAYEQSPLAGNTDTMPWLVETQKSLSRLGASASGPALVSVLSFSEPRRGFLGVYRFDWPSFWLGDSEQTQREWQPEMQSSGKRAFATQLWDWAKAYQQVATQGFTNDAPEDGRGVADFAPTAMK